MEQTSGNWNISSLTASRRYRGFPVSFVYFSYSRYLVNENRAGHESRNVGLLPDSRNWSIILISAHAEYSVMLTKIQILNPGSRRNMLQGPDPIYACGQFYPCRWFYWNKGKFSADALSSTWRCAFWIWALEYYLKHVVMHWLVVGYTSLCTDSHWLQGVCSQCQDSLRSQNLALGTTNINSSKINFALCLGKALCTSVGDANSVFAAAF